MTKQEKLRDNLEQTILELKEAWDAFVKERDTSMVYPDKLDRVTNLVRLILEVVSKSNDTLNAFSIYTAALEKKLKIPKRNDSKRKK